MTTERIEAMHKAADTWPKDPGELSNMLDECLDELDRQRQRIVELETALKQYEGRPANNGLTLAE